MPRLNCTYKEFIAILKAHGFVLDRQERSHRQWIGVYDGKTRLVTVSPHGSDKAQIGLDVLQSMIRQSGLPKKLFRK